MKNTISILLLLLCTSIYAQDDTTMTNEFESTIINNTESLQGDVGSFGRKLSHLTSFVSLNGYATNEFRYYEDGTTTFDNHYFNLIASAEISKHIFTEIQMEYEYGGSVLNARYAQVDYKFNDLFIIRSGKFLVPAGEFNEFLYPEYLSKTINRAYVNEEIIPVSWGEVGVQLKGQLNKDSSLIKPFYSIYLVNGLKGENGGNIRNMRDNVVDNAKKVAYGGNIGSSIGKYISLQFNYYYGDYDTTTTLDLELAGVSFSYNNNKLSLYGAYHFARQEFYPDTSDLFSKEVLHKYGFYGQIAYKYKKFEPVIRFDQIKLDGLKELDRDRFTFGLNYHFYAYSVVKINYELIKNKGIDIKDNAILLQLAIGF